MLISYWSSDVCSSDLKERPFDKLRANGFWDSLWLCAGPSGRLRLKLVPGPIPLRREILLVILVSWQRERDALDRKSDGEGKRGSGRLKLGGSGITKKTNI